MTRQALGKRKLRKYSGFVGEEIVSALARGGSHVIYFVTASHRHGAITSTTPHILQWLGKSAHFSSCRERFPCDFDS